MHDAAQNALAPLVGLPLRCIGRAVVLLWAHFGELREIPTRKAGTRTVGEWALHVQCPWRISQPPSILVASGDYLYAADGNEPYDPRSGRESRFDRRAAPLNTDFRRGSTARHPMIGRVEAHS